MRFICIVFITFVVFINPALSKKDTILLINNTKVEIRYPVHERIGVILVLPGWNFPQDDICIKSGFCNQASKLGYLLVMPDMQKSVYHTTCYNETRSDWRNYHTVSWLKDTVLHFLLYNFDLFKPNDKNYLFGISTGGRGVTIMAIYTDSIFRAGAALSGDYDQTQNTSDNLMRGYFGDYSNFSERWKGIENPIYNVKRIKIPLLLAHGAEDKIVSPGQSSRFYDSLMVNNPKLGHVLEIKQGASHDYTFWSSKYKSVFDFFSKY